jgi:hypothetical protein
MPPLRTLWRVDWNTFEIVAVIELAPKKERTLMFLDGWMKRISAQFGSLQSWVPLTSCGNESRGRSRHTQRLSHREGSSNPREIPRELLRRGDAGQ